MTDHRSDRQTEQDRYDRGLAVLTRVDGEGGQRVVDSLADIAPDLAHHVVAFGFGDVYSRPGPRPSSANSSPSAY